jgi:archaeal flagellin FlaB
MRKIGKSLGKFEADDRANIGIGTLIIFIAMVLVAAVAASVLIQTAESLNGKAKHVANSVIRETTTGLQIVGSYGYTDENKTTVMYIALLVETMPGSYPIDLNDTKVYVQTDEFYVLSPGNCECMNLIGRINNSLFHSISMHNLTRSVFGIVAIKDDDLSVTNAGGMDCDDKIAIMISLENLSVGDFDDEIRIKIVPDTGFETTIEIYPPIFNGHRVINLES